MISMNLSDIAILNINSVDYCCIITRISKSETVNLLQKADWNAKKKKKKNIIEEHITNILRSKKISFGKKNYKYFINYLYDDYVIKLLHIMLPKTKAYVKDYDGQTKLM